MAANLYEFQNQFRLVDVDGVILDNPDDYIIIREPNGFSESQITLKRDKDNHGFDFEYTDAEVSYGFTRAMNVSGEAFNPYNLISLMYSSAGVDAQCVFQFLNYNSITLMYDVQFEANLDFSTYTAKDYSIDLLARRVNFGDLFRTRIEVPVNLNSTESIDGDVITAATSEDLFLHSKLKRQSCFSSNDTIIDLERNFSTPLYTEKRLYLDSDGIEFTDGSRSFIDLIENSLGSSLIAFLADRPAPISTVVLWNGWNALNLETKTYNVYVESTYTVNVENNGDEDLILWVGFVKKFYDQEQDDAVWLSGRNEYTIPIGGSLNVTETVNGELTINNTDTTGSDIWFATSRVRYSGDVTMTMTNVSYFLTRDVVADNSTAEVYNAKEAINQVLHSITGVDDAYESDFFDTNAPNMYLTNGYKIRKFENRNVIISFDDLFKKWAQPVFGLGRAITGTDSLKILIERYEFFYQDVEIDYIDTLQDNTFEASIDKDIIFNEIKIGYKDFPKSTDENKGQNLDEFNTTQSLITPIKTIKKKKEYISDTIGSGYLIENQRIEQFKKVPQDTVSNDDKLFSFVTINNDTYTLDGSFGSGEFNVISDPVTNTISLLGSYFDIRPDDVIELESIGTSNPLEGVYTVVSVELNNNRFDMVCTSVVSATSSEGKWVITLPESRLRAARNEEFVTLDDVISPETVYNVGLNPKYMLLNQSTIINSGFNPKPETDVIKTQEAKLNSDMNCAFRGGEGDYVLGGGTLVSMDGDIPLSDVNSYSRLFSGLLFKFTANITYQRLLTIRDSYLNESGNADNYGYISFKAPNGIIYKGYLMELKYNPMSQQAEFLLRGKFDPTGESF